MEEVSGKNIKIEFAIGEEVILLKYLINRSTGASIEPLDSSQPVTQVSVNESGLFSYNVAGVWRSSKELIRKQDAQKEALKFLAGRINAILGLSD